MGNPICHFEIGGQNLARSRAFYENLFDWDMRPDLGSVQINTGGEVDGQLTALGPDPQQYVTVYVLVDDIVQSLNEAVALGGRVVVGPTAVGDDGMYAWIADPDDNIIGLYMED